MSKNNFINNKQELIADAVSKILISLGEDTSRKGLQDTPKRVATSLQELTKGYGATPLDVVGDAIFPCESKGMIMQKNIEFFSLCEHHLLPFFGKAHIAYVPNKQIIGLSKIGRIIDIFSKRLQVQENLTHQIAQTVDSLLRPKGVAVVIEAQHFCMMMRGVKKQGGLTITNEFTGLFKDDIHMRSDFLTAIANR